MQDIQKMQNEGKLIVSSSPHILNTDSTKSIMWTVSIFDTTNNFWYICLWTLLALRSGFCYFVCD